MMMFQCLFLLGIISFASPNCFFFIEDVYFYKVYSFLRGLIAWYLPKCVLLHWASYTFVYVIQTIGSLVDLYLFLLYGFHSIPVSCSLPRLESLHLWFTSFWFSYGMRCCSLLYVKADQNTRVMKRCLMACA
ncbi:hypothetical protein EDC96DRAFT_570207 [Choanephora cucurbitarum]|nr:hypothetical protein EDC96DRAFT_570207 [Choanephora cucurbitarum]